MIERYHKQKSTKMNYKNYRFRYFGAFIFITLLFGSLPISSMISNQTTTQHYNSSEIDFLDTSGWKDEITKDVDNAPYDLYVGDVNNDGYNDIVTADYLSDRYVSVMLWNNSIDDWDPIFSKEVGPHPLGVCIGDANNDGYYDIVGTNHDNNEVSILLWNNSLTDWNPAITKSIGDTAYDVSVADCNNDGYNDIVTANYASNDLSIFFWNYSNLNWNPKITISVGRGPRSVNVNDINNDGQNELIVANSRDDNLLILYWSNITETWDTQITKSVGDAPQGVHSGDVNNDGFNDIVSANSVDDNISIFLWNNTTSDWNSELGIQVDRTPRSVFIGDANNDGINDIATANVAFSNFPGTISILCWNDTIGDWNPRISKIVGNYPRSIFIDDVDNDGKNDIVVANMVDSTVSIFSWQLDSPILSPILPNPNHNGKIQLNWNKVIGATIYYIYKDTSHIFSLAGLVPINRITSNTYTDIISSDGYYYYVVVAGDNLHNSSMSNCVYIEISITQNETISGYIMFPFFAILVLTALLLVKNRHK